MWIFYNVKKLVKEKNKYETGQKKKKKKKRK